MKLYDIIMHDLGSYELLTEREDGLLEIKDDLGHRIYGIGDMSTLCFCPNNLHDIFDLDENDLSEDGIVFDHFIFVEDDNDENITHLYAIYYFEIIV